MGNQLAHAAIDAGKNASFKTFLLVSVNESVAFWSALGFRSLEQIQYAPRTLGYTMVMELPDGEQEARRGN